MNITSTKESIVNYKPAHIYWCILLITMCWYSASLATAQGRWQQIGRESFTGVAYLSNETIAVSGPRGKVIFSHDGSRSWYQDNVGVQAGILGIDFKDSLHGAAAGARGFITLTGDGGKSWRQIGSIDSTI